MNTTINFPGEAAFFVFDSLSEIVVAGIGSVEPQPRAAALHGVIDRGSS